MSDIGTFGMMPGIGSLIQSVEAQVWFGKVEQQLFAGGIIGASAVDAGNSPTSVLRTGLVLGQKTSDGNLYPYSATNTDGTQVAKCVLIEGLSMLNSLDVAEQKTAPIILAGSLKASQLIGLDVNARRQLISSGRFYFDDDMSGADVALGHPQSETALTANYTVLTTDNGTLFTNTGATGAVTATLPAIASSAGLSFEFLVTTAQNVTVSSAEGTNVVHDGNAGRSSLAFSTSSHQIGGHLLFTANTAGTLWYVRTLCPYTCTITAA